MSSEHYTPTPKCPINVRFLSVSFIHLSGMKGAFAQSGIHAGKTRSIHLARHPGRRDGLIRGRGGIKYSGRLETLNEGDEYPHTQVDFRV